MWRRAAILGLIVGLWPIAAMAQVGGDPAGPGGTGQQVQGVGSAQLVWHPATVGGGRNPGDPDTWDEAVTPGWFEAVLNLMGTADAGLPGITGSCTPAGGQASAVLTMPSMWVGSNPYAPGSQSGAGLGGIVGDQTYFWVHGERDRVKISPEVHVQVTNCVAVPGVPPHWAANTVDHWTQLRYTAGTPVWNWADGSPPSAGWGDVNGRSLGHTYQVSSGMCGPLSRCVDVAGKGPSYHVWFDLASNIDFMADGAVNSFPFPTSRHRVFPVREVQSVLDR